MEVNPRLALSCVWRFSSRLEARMRTGRAFSLTTLGNAVTIVAWEMGAHRMSTLALSALPPHQPHLHLVLCNIWRTTHGQDLATELATSTALGRKCGVDIHRRPEVRPQRRRCAQPRRARPPRRAPRLARPPASASISRSVRAASSEFSAMPCSRKSGLGRRRRRVRDTLS